MRKAPRPRQRRGRGTGGHRPQGPAAAARSAAALSRSAIASGCCSRFFALIVAALTTLVVPIAVRRMIDFGFSGESNLIDKYFGVMVAVAAVLALASSLRFYLVTTLGERIVADLRNDVFAHLTRLSAAFFDTRADRRDDVAAHRRHDADQVGGRLGGLGRLAQSRAVRRRGHDDDRDLAAAVVLRARRDPGDRAAAGRVRARGAPPLAARAG